MIQILSEALAERGYDTLTPVQEAVTAPGLETADLLVSAQTGSGKTVAFGLAIGPTLLEGEGLGPAAAPLALIIAPTRELAFQVTRELDWLYAKAGARVVSCVGGMDIRDERRALERGAHIVVGTPGRLKDHIQRGALELDSLRAVVLDEADEMLDLGFREDLEFMLGAAPVDRRTLMFSATVPPMIATLAQHYQRDAQRITTLSDKGQHADIAYQALRVAQQDAETAIVNVLRFHDAENAIVFANTRATVARLTARFANRGFAVVSLSGELSQGERTHALQAMRDGRARVCVATDVAARGIDLPNLDLVVHAELPNNPEVLLHRSGRTGRAGRKGVSALIVPPRAENRARRLLKFARLTAEWTVPPGADEILRRDEERLLNDPAWEAEISAGEASFAASLLERHAPEAVAAAYLRLYRARHSAPEVLADPTAPAPAKERKPFGPSAWFALSVGRDDRAEARWLLPLLCRAGDLEKDAIGAIRVQQTETFVEIAEASVPGFLSRLGEGGVLEKDVRARQVDGPPAGAAGGPRPRPRKDGERSERPARAPREDRAERPARGPSADAPAPAAPEAPSAAPRAEPEAAQAPKPRRDDAAPAARKPRAPKRAEGGPAAGGAGRFDKPRGAPRGEGKPGAKRPGGKPGGKPGAGKPFGARDDAPRKPAGPGKAGKPAKPRGAPAPAARANAADTSKRFTPPKPGAKPGSKPGARPAKRGGMEPPRRPSKPRG